MATQTLALPPPYLGQMDRVPVAALENPYCEICDNFNLDDGVPTLRYSDSIHAEMPSDVIPYALATYGEGVGGKLFACGWDGTDITFNDVSTSSVSLVHTHASTTASLTGVRSVEFNNHIYFFFSGTTLAPIDYNGLANTWGTSTFTFPAYATRNFVPAGGCVHRNRLYFFDDYTALAYANINAVGSSTVTVRDYSSLVSQKANFVGMRSVTTVEGQDSANMLAMVFDNGEVFFYAGAWPDSPDWAIARRFQIAPPILFNPLVDAAGDTYVATTTGLISLRGLLSGGEEAARRDSISKDIPNRWKQITAHYGYDAGLRRVRSSGVYDKTEDRLVLGFLYDVTRETGQINVYGLRLVYSFKTKGWWEHKVATARSFLTYFQGRLYGANLTTWGVGTPDNISKVEGGDGFESTYYRLYTAPLPTSKYQTNKIQGIEILLNTDLYDKTYFYFMRDLKAGVQWQKVTGPDSQIHKTFVNIGADSTYLQLVVYGQTGSDEDASTGLKIYGYNAWYSPGGLR